MRYCYFLVPIIYILVSGCVSTQSVADRTASKYVGKSIDLFVLDHGAPHREFQLHSGDIAYTWSSGITSIEMPPTATTTMIGDTAYTHIHDGEVINLYCELQIITDADGTVKHIKILKDTVGALFTSRCHEVLN